MKGIHETASIFYTNVSLPQTLVVFDNYERFIRLMLYDWTNCKGFVVTGQPGIGSWFVDLVRVACR